MLIKVCGLKETENIHQIAQLPIDYMGFIFYPKSKRYALPGLNVELLKNIQKPKIGVFVNETYRVILAFAKTYSLNFIQLHGNEKPKLAKKLKENGLKVIKAFNISADFNFDNTLDFEDCTDVFIFDSSSKKYGGSGKKFNWQILQKYKGSKPFLLSGGIENSDLEAIKQFSHPKFIGLDINSRFETKPGLKDVEKIKNFIKKLNPSHEQ